MEVVGGIGIGGIGGFVGVASIRWRVCMCACVFVQHALVYRVYTFTRVLLAGAVHTACLKFEDASMCWLARARASNGRDET